MSKTMPCPSDKVLLVTPPSSPWSRKSSLFLVSGLLCTLYIFTDYFVLPFERYAVFSKVQQLQGSCPQVEPLHPQKHASLASGLATLYDSKDFERRAVDWIAGAIQVPTESYDEMDDIGVDPRWEVFGELHPYFEKAFPLVHKHLTLTKVNTYGLLYTWKGTDEKLKPLLLMAHQDVVPVEPSTIGSWTHPPYSGYFDGTYVWGRGSVDDKSSLVGILASVETLLESNFSPTRTIILSFGFDEEASGTQGAKKLAAHLLETLGPDSIAMIVDEGGGIAELNGGLFALPNVAEKGYLDVKIEVKSAGGHSSIPPAHTGIGFLSALLVALESHPHPANLLRTSTFYESIQCIGEYGVGLPSHIRKAIKRSSHSDRALHDVEQYFLSDTLIKALLQTTQAITVINGGVKANALPEQAYAVVNHRIATESSVKRLQDQLADLITPHAKAFNASLNAFGHQIFDGSDPALRITLSDAWGTALEPAPVSPSTGSEPYRILSGTIRATGISPNVAGGSNRPLTVAPSVLGGNTDTQFYWALTRNIYRYSHLSESSGGAIHTINEYLHAGDFTQLIKFYTNLVLNVDEATSL